jgi:hypothetical protein
MTGHGSPFRWTTQGSGEVIRIGEGDLVCVRGAFVMPRMIEAPQEHCLAGYLPEVGQAELAPRWRAEHTMQGIARLARA